MESEWKDCRGGSPDCKKKVLTKFKECYPCREYQQKQAKAPIKEEFVAEHKSNGSLRVRIIEANTGAEFEKMINSFKDKNKVVATQTHVNIMQTSTGWQALYTAVIYHE